MTAILTYLRLCRFPTVFTALADIFLGYLLSHSELQPYSEVGLLLLACGGLYLSGMVFNDLFDIQQDSQERPQRPIPSGAVSWRRALIFGSVLMFIGLTAAGLVGAVSLQVAGCLALMILLYDRFLKRTFLGPLAMGSCRFLNIALGSSPAAPRFVDVFRNPTLWVALCMGVYIIGVTWFAKREAATNRRAPLIGALLTINLGLVGLLLWMTDLTSQLGLFVVPGAVQNRLAIGFLWGIIVLTINRRAISAVLQPTPARIQPTIGTLLLSIIVIDAMLIYYKIGPPGVPYAIATLLLLLPAIILKRYIPLT